ncbi:hypothetical protein BJ170DRAFT_682225 [Xylariales sp. AK1849]|nr:hypothetical protein BJ170DRAFT_682225 [Xylariales sp. AK1849]
MFSYIVGGIAFLLFFYNPIFQYLSPGPALIPRGPRPAINESLLAIDAASETAPSCSQDAYSTHILSKAPLVIYVENFISEDERAHILDISNPLFAPSTISHNGASVQHDATIRNSSVALIPRTETVRCIEQRALAFQGWREDLWIEHLRTQRYGTDQHYAHHFDWGSGARGWGRVSSIMAWVAGTAGDDLEGGGTEFPLLRRRRGSWCKWVECPEVQGSGENGEAGDDGTKTQDGLGVTFKPIAGNAVFWENFRPDGTGRGWDETWHAGLPVKDGVKIGLNVWSWGRLD